VLLVYAISLLALRQPRLLRLVDEPAAGAGSSAPPVSPLDDGASPRRKYEGSPLSPEEVTALRARALAHLHAERAFLRPDLALSQLAAELGTLANHLSRAINEGGESFPELVARLRVEEAARLLDDPGYDHLTVEALGRRAGFPSRSAFYETFRRLRGTTPSAHRDRRRPARPDS
jgi:AraC-like DNA-binding protein